MLQQSGPEVVHPFGLVRQAGFLQDRAPEQEVAEQVTSHLHALLHSTAFLHAPAVHAILQGFDGAQRTTPWQVLEPAHEMVHAPVPVHTTSFVQAPPEQTTSQLSEATHWRLFVQLAEPEQISLQLASPAGHAQLAPQVTSQMPFTHFMFGPVQLGPHGGA